MQSSVVFNMVLDAGWAMGFGDGKVEWGWVWLNKTVLG